MGEKIRSVGAEVGAELAQLESQLESAIHDALAAALEAKWPVSRWPIYVFTGGWMPGRVRQQGEGGACGQRTGSWEQWGCGARQRGAKGGASPEHSSHT